MILVTKVGYRKSWLPQFLEEYGTCKVCHLADDNGVAIQRNAADNVTLTRFADGSVLREDAEVKSLLHADGTIDVDFGNGTAVRRLVNGTVLVRDPDGGQRVLLTVGVQ